MASGPREYDYIMKNWSYADLYLAYMINKKNPE